MPLDEALLFGWHKALFQGDRLSDVVRVLISTCERDLELRGMNDGKFATLDGDTRCGMLWIASRFFENLPGIDTVRNHCRIRVL